MAMASSSYDWPKHDDILNPDIDDVNNDEGIALNNFNSHNSNGGGGLDGNVYDDYNNTSNADESHIHDQLGTVEQARIDNYVSTPRSNCMNRKRVILFCSVVTMIAIIIGVSVGISKKNKSDQYGSGNKSISSSSDSSKKKPPLTSKNKPYYQDRIQDVFDFVQLISSQKDVLDENSPQHRAAVWMALKDEAHLKTPTDYYEEGYELEKNSPGVTVVQNHYRFVQRYILAIFYYAMDGDYWNSRLNFGNNVHECQWYKMLGNGKGVNSKIGVQCDEANNRVVGLIMPDNNLNGILPPEFAYFKDMRYVIMQRNNIHGSIPSDLAHSTTLNTINLSDNNLSGPLPATLGRTEKLKILELANNGITGTLPLDMKVLTDLETINLSNNNMEGDVDILTQVSSLQNIYLNGNSFSGNTNNFHRLPNLIDLVLRNNNIGGALPMSLFEHPALKTLDLSSNSIVGPIPNPIPSNIYNVLEYVSLSNNQLTANIPDSISNLGKLKYLDLSQNDLSGILAPQSMSSMNSLEFLYLDSNSNFEEGEIPEMPLRSMIELTQLTLGGTNRIGDLPPWLEDLSNLNLLDVSSNNNLDGEGEFFCKEMPSLQIMADCNLIRNCNCCTCCESEYGDGSVGCISQGNKYTFVVPTKSFELHVQY